MRWSHAALTLGIVEVFAKRAAGITLGGFVMLGSLLASATPASADTNSIQQLPTSTAAFVGVVGKPNPQYASLGLPVTSFGDFTAGFPSASPEMTNSVRSFFVMGGSEMSVYPASSNEPADLITAINTTSTQINGEAPANSLVVPALSTLIDDDYYSVAIAMNTVSATSPAMAILDLPQQVVQTAMSTNSTVGPVEVAETLSRMLPHPASAALYTSPLVNPDVGVVSAAGPVAGLYAANDVESGVWTDPAGDSLSLSGYTAQWLPTPDEMGEMGPIGLNSFVVSPNTGNVRLYGARTLSPNNPDSRYIGEERFAQSISTSITKGLGWAAFEPAGPHLWSQIDTSVTEFMNGLVEQGAFGGELPTAGEFYFVTVNQTNNSVADIHAGLVNIDLAYQSKAQYQMIPLRVTIQAGRGF